MRQCLVKAQQQKMTTGAININRCPLTQSPAWPRRRQGISYQLVLDYKFAFQEAQKPFIFLNGEVHALSSTTAQ
jgi:hypothetical protein